MEEGRSVGVRAYLFSFSASRGDGIPPDIYTGGSPELRRWYNVIDLHLVLGSLRRTRTEVTCRVIYFSSNKTRCRKSTICFLTASMGRTSFSRRQMALPILPNTSVNTTISASFVSELSDLIPHFACKKIGAMH